MMDGKKSEAKVPAFKVRPPVTKKRRKHKPKDFPKRPLSAYNIFFKETREKLLIMKESGEDHGDNVDFQSMVKEIASRWKKLGSEEKVRVESLAKEDLLRYKDEVRAYEETMVKRSRLEREESALQKKQEAETAAAGRRQQVAEEEHARSAQQMSRAHAALPDYSHIDARQGAEEMQRLLAEELRATEIARELRLRQLRLAHQMQSGASSAVASFEAQRMAAGLPTLGGEQDVELDMMKRQNPNPSSYTSMPPTHGGDLGMSGGLLPQMHPSHPSSLYAAREEALLRNYAQRFSERELLSSQLHGLSHLNHSRDGALSGLTGSRAALLSRADQMSLRSRIAAEQGLLPPLDGMAGMRRPEVVPSIEGFPGGGHLRVDGLNHSSSRSGEESF
jgi:hypothetical protein